MTNIFASTVTDFQGDAVIHIHVLKTKQFQNLSPHPLQIYRIIVYLQKKKTKTKKTRDVCETFCPPCIYITG
jgi:hypothetical protein